MRSTGKGIASIGSLILLLALAACQPAVNSPVYTKAADEAAVRHVLDEIVRNFNAGNLDGMFALYRNDTVVSSPGAPDFDKAVWRVRIDQSLDALPANTTLRMRFDTRELEVSGDLAYERGIFFTKSVDKVTGAALGEEEVAGLYIHIFKREVDGSWKGWRLMEAFVDPAPSTQARPAQPTSVKP
jgi:ketosteroid isomerase-like protein